MHRSIAAAVAVMLAVVAASVAVIVIASLSSRLDRDALDAVAIQRDAYHLAQLEWQAVAEKALSARVDHEQREVRARLLRRVDAGQGEGSSLFRDLGRATLAYDRALAAQFAALRSGDLETAETIDEERVDPTFERLQELTREAAERASQRADRIGELLTVLSVLVVLITTVSVAALLRREARRAASDARHHAEQASAERLSAMVAGAADVVSVTDAAGDLTYLSPAIEQVTGRAADDLLGTPAIDIAHPADRDKIAAALLKALSRSSGTAQVEYRVRHATEGERVCESRLRRLDGEESASVVWNTRDISDRKALEQQLSYQAFHDPVTSLANRALLHDRVGHALQRAARGVGQPAVIVLDLDGFKDVNDSLGHAAGDDLLRVISERLQSISRTEDTVARLGGDEFAVLVEPPSAMEDAMALADRILSVVRAPITLYERQLYVTASVGLAWAGSDHEGDLSASALIRSADLAMYVAKQRGKNQMATYERSMQAHAVQRLELISDLHGAAQRGEIRVAYQPIVSLNDSAVLGFEALVRWQHPLRGLLLPTDFLGLAEESGAIVDLGAYVVTTAVHQVAQWRRAHGKPYTISVNLSDRQLADDNLVTTISEALRSSGLPPAAVTLEITESTLVGDVNSAHARLTALRAIGVKVAIDDFGTGYSSLSYLRNLPVDILKIDRSFVGDQTSQHADNLLAAVVALGSAMAVQTVAEGVEDQDQLDRLKRLGCGQGQGFLFAHPLWADEITRDPSVITGPVTQSGRTGSGHVGR